MLFYWIYILNGQHKFCFWKFPIFSFQSVKVDRSHLDRSRNRNFVIPQLLVKGQSFQCNQKVISKQIIWPFVQFQQKSKTLLTIMNSAHYPNIFETGYPNAFKTGCPTVVFKCSGAVLVIHQLGLQQQKKLQHRHINVQL